MLSFKMYKTAGIDICTVKAPVSLEKQPLLR